MAYRRWFLILTLLLMACGREEVPSATVEMEDPVQLGARKARVCMGCHGPKGISRIASYPSLAGKSEAYLAEQMRAFKSGERENPMMNAMATNLNEDDILHLAAYFSAQATPGGEPQGGAGD
ncbi:c-type cytochrome [Gilvimarinus algae]|uniref:Cytochrome c n=1 Tax=Gilvimarinus algae TaxID=3058037 RepID=A0ABT8TF78_9GAMM|nr:cytochrome c [Gilvimarinus sp. SDUM040014]MDO3382698.1 cytochrome c [Gilvimarinus sp. SDUM040014]